MTDYLASKFVIMPNPSTKYEEPCELALLEICLKTASGVLSKPLNVP